MTPQDAIELLSLAARSATWSGADPKLARELLEVVRATDDGNTPGYNREKARTYGRVAYEERIRAEKAERERDEARAEVEARTKERDDARAQVCEFTCKFTSGNHYDHSITHVDGCRRALIERLTRPIDGLSPGPVYALADVDRIEAVRGKPYERLRATVAEVERLTKERDEALGRAAKLESKLTTMATDVLAGLAAAGIATPVEGYREASWAVSGDIARLAKERDAAHALVDEAVRKRDEVHAEVERLTKERDDYLDGAAVEAMEADHARTEVERLKAELRDAKVLHEHDESVYRTMRADLEASERHLAECAADPKPTTPPVCRYDDTRTCVGCAPGDCEFTPKPTPPVSPMAKVAEALRTKVALESLRMRCATAAFGAVRHSQQTTDQCRSEVRAAVMSVALTDEEAADPNPTPPVDVPNLGPRSPLTDAEYLASLEPESKPIERPDLGPKSPADLVGHDLGEFCAEIERRTKGLSRAKPPDGQEVFPVAVAAAGSKSLREMLLSKQWAMSPLRANNGRDALLDAREELAYAYLFLTQAIMEQKANPKPKRTIWSLEVALVAVVTAWDKLEAVPDTDKEDK